MPKVSVIVPNYNHARFLERRIQSILDQTYQDFELIYLDDASTDNSNKIFARFADRPHVHTIFNETNSGSPFKQWSRGIQHANGEYIWIAESDDYADPRFLETLVPILYQQPQVGLAYCQSYQIDEHDQLLTTLYWWTNDLSQDRWHKDFINSGIEECCNYLVFKNTIPNASAVLSRRSIFSKIDVGYGSLRLCGDWLVWIQLLMHSDVAFSGKILNYFRQHDTCVRNSTSHIRYLKERMQVFAFINQHLNLSRQISETMKEQLVKEWLIILLITHRDLNFGQRIDLYRAAKSFEAWLELRVLNQLGAAAVRKLKREIQSLIPVSN